MKSGEGFTRDTDRMIRLAVVCTLVGLCGVLAFLVYGFAPWSMGVGVFAGSPILVLGMAVYVCAVIGDLRRHDVL